MDLQFIHNSIYGSRLVIRPNSLHVIFLYYFMKFAKYFISVKELTQIASSYTTPSSSLLRHPPSPQIVYLQNPFYLI